MRNADMLLYIRGISSIFKGFDEDQLQILAENMSFMQYESGQPVMQKGEQGTWFGILLSGSLVPLPVSLSNALSYLFPAAVQGAPPRRAARRARPPRTRAAQITTTRSSSPHSPARPARTATSSSRSAPPRPPPSARSPSCSSTPC